MRFYKLIKGALMKRALMNGALCTSLVTLIMSTSLHQAAAATRGSGSSHSSLTDDEERQLNEAILILIWDRLISQSSAIRAASKNIGESPKERVLCGKLLGSALLSAISAANGREMLLPTSPPGSQWAMLGNGPMIRSFVLPELQRERMTEQERHNEHKFHNLITLYREMATELVTAYENLDSQSETRNRETLRRIKRGTFPE